LNEKGYNHFTVNQSVNFKDPETGAHSNTIESTWRHAKVTLPNYRRKKEFYGGYLAKYMFIKKCRNHEQDPTVQFFNAAGSLYSVDDDVENVDVQAEEQQAEDENSEEEDNEHMYILTMSE